MSNQTLNIGISQTGLKFFSAMNEQIVLVRSYEKDTGLTVVSAVFPPFGNNNSVQFLDQFYLYASTSPISAQTVVNMQIKQNVDIGNTYAFDGTGITGSGDNCPPNEFGLINQQPNGKPLTSGMAQMLSINDASGAPYITSIESIPLNQTAYFEPNATLRILAAKGIASNMLIQSSMINEFIANRGRSESEQPIVGKSLEIDLDETTNIYYDDSTNLFKKGTLPSL